MPKMGIEADVHLLDCTEVEVELTNENYEESSVVTIDGETRRGYKIAFVPEIGTMWQSEQPENDVPLNACVVWDAKDDEYYVFVTTDTTKTAKQIIQTYELRPEIEEDYRQLKDFWRLEDFKSTKINVIAFHIVCTLLGYLMFQIYVGTEEGERWSGKSLPVIVKKYIPPDKPKSVIIAVPLYI